MKHRIQNYLHSCLWKALLDPFQAPASGGVKEWETFNKIWIIKICSKKRQWWLLNKIKDSEIFLFFLNVFVVMDGPVADRHLLLRRWWFPTGSSLWLVHGIAVRQRPSLSLSSARFGLLCLRPKFEMPCRNVIPHQVLPVWRQGSFTKSCSRF